MPNKLKFKIAYIESKRFSLHLFVDCLYEIFDNSMLYSFHDATVLYVHFIQVNNNLSTTYVHKKSKEIDDIIKWHGIVKNLLVVTKVDSVYIYISDSRLVTNDKWDRKVNIDISRCLSEQREAKNNLLKIYKKNYSSKK